jgi:hypothetical protein
MLLLSYIKEENGMRDYNNMSHKDRTREDYRNMLEDVVNELDLSESMIEKHGQCGTAPAELVRLVLEQKDLQISALSRGMKMIS